MAELKPGPFCGAPARMWSWNYGVRVECSAFSITHLVGIEGKTEKEAIEAWNRRAGNDKATNR